jgi:hypothetical protein
VENVGNDDTGLPDDDRVAQTAAAHNQCVMTGCFFVVVGGTELDNAVTGTILRINA